jgi:hypothetical protein
MPNNIHAPSVEISASTTTANALLPVNNSKYLRVVNTTDGTAYVNAGATNAITATNANIGVPPRSVATFERFPNTDLYVAVILSTGATSGLVSVATVGVPD